MSTVFRVWCTDDAVAGPKLQRTAGGTGLIYQDAWATFLIEHEYHRLALVHEIMDGGARPVEHVLNVEEVWKMGPGAEPLPAHVITSEGAFWPDEVTPFEITADQYRAAGWKLRRRLVTDWVDA